jgi:hypothetical protein
MDELTEKLNKGGFKIIRSGVYHTLLPKRVASFKGRHHVVTIPVEII